jgi:phage terminase Nu1 subunit (DNA packaging protein)
MITLATCEEVGALLHRKPHTILKWARDGLIPAMSRGDHFVFNLDEVARWAREREKAPSETGKPRAAACIPV